MVRCFRVAVTLRLITPSGRRGTTELKPMRLYGATLQHSAVFLRLPSTPIPFLFFAGIFGANKSRGYYPLPRQKTALCGRASRTISRPLETRIKFNEICINLFTHRARRTKRRAIANALVSIASVHGENSKDNEILMLFFVHA